MTMLHYCNPTGMDSVPFVGTVGQTYSRHYRQDSYQKDSLHVTKVPTYDCLQMCLYIS